MEKLYTKAFVENIGDKDGVLESAVITSEVLDREGEVLKADGGVFENFLKNPVMLWAHNRKEDRLPIGRILKIWRDGNKWKFTPEFDLKDTFAAEVCRKYKDGFLNAFSVGFLPIEQDGNSYERWEALEFSPVPVPANAEALVSLRAKGFETSSWEDVMKKEVETKVVVEFPPEFKEGMSKLIKKVDRLEKKLSRKKRIEDQPKWSELKHLVLILNKATSKVLEEIKKGGDKN